MKKSSRNYHIGTIAPFLSLAVCASGVLLSSNAASAAVINVNIASGGGATTTTNPDYGLWGEGDNTWNVSSLSSGSNLVDSGNNATTVDYSYTGWGSGNGNSGWGPDNLTNNGKYGPNDVPTIHNLTISQLSAGQAYELIFYFADNNPNETMTAEGAGPDIFGESKITTGGTTYVEGGAGVFWYFNNVTADGGGEIEVLASGAGYETITGFQLRAVPEPSSTALLGLGGLALMLRRRR